MLLWAQTHCKYFIPCPEIVGSTANIKTPIWRSVDMEIIMLGQLPRCYTCLDRRVSKAAVRGGTLVCNYVHNIAQITSITVSFDNLSVCAM